jgi:hypothetical protein
VIYGKGCTGKDPFSLPGVQAAQLRHDKKQKIALRQD